MMRAKRVRRLTPQRRRNPGLGDDADGVAAQSEGGLTPASGRLRSCLTTVSAFDARHDYNSDYHLV